MCPVIEIGPGEEMASASNPRILIVDDNPAVRSGLRTLLEITADTLTVNEAANTKEALHQVQLCKPDLMILDLYLTNKDEEEMQGLSILKTAKAVQPMMQVYILTVDGRPATRREAILAGADGFFTKGKEFQKLLSSIQQFIQNQSF